MFMTGALCVIGAGTAVQPMIASLAQLFFLLLILKLAPFDNPHDDWSAFASSLTLTIHMIIAFALMTDGDGDEATFDSNLLGYILVTISIFCFVVQLVIAGHSLNLPNKCKKLHQLATGKAPPLGEEEDVVSELKKKQDKAEEEKNSKTKITPLNKNVRDWEISPEDSAV